MWICLSDSFLSIVADRNSGSLLRVRARIEGDIERVFPDVQIEDRGYAHDYRFVALVDRAAVATKIAERLLDVRYDNFKSSVRESDRHDAYLSMWFTMRRLGERRDQHDVDSRLWGRFGDEVARSYEPDDDDEPGDGRPDFEERVCCVDTDPCAQCLEEAYDR